MNITQTRGSTPPMRQNEYGDVWINDSGSYVWGGEVQTCDAPCSHCYPRTIDQWMPVSDDYVQLHINTFLG